MTAHEIRTRFLKYFEGQKHTVVPSSSLLPDDPSVLLTTAGMQQFKPYYTRAADPIKDFNSLSTTSSQKSFRTSDIDEVGDDTHLTFFEMLGNFSFGGYFKKEAITFAHEFITKELGLEISYVTIFEGSDSVPKDEESREIWKSLGVTDVREEGMDDVFWGPTGSSGPCGPTTELYCKNAIGEDVEIWNIVFNEFFYPGSRDELLSGNKDKKLEPLEHPGVDTGMGLERLAMIAQKTKNIFETDLFTPILEKISFRDPEYDNDRVRRIIADHVRAISFLISDGVRPSNKEAGYILRRLMRRVIVYGANTEELLSQVVNEYRNHYKELDEKVILEVFDEEQAKFNKALKGGLKELEKDKESIDAKAAFRLYESYGLPFEIIKEKVPHLTHEEFDAEFKKHQEKSRAGQEKKFGGHGLVLDTGELKAKDEEELKKVTRLHSATHLMQAALRAVLGDGVQQRGSDITVERTRFDLSFDRKITREELDKVEEIVNSVVERDLEVKEEEMSFEEAKERGALHFFKDKYPETVKVYSFVEKDGKPFSMELCGGPHVTHTQEIGKFRIIKEEASSAGVRRVRATVEP